MGAFGGRWLSGLAGFAKDNTELPLVRVASDLPLAKIRRRARQMDSRIGACDELFAEGAGLADAPAGRRASSLWSATERAANRP
jgi:hypothetical protein